MPIFRFLATGPECSIVASVVAGVTEEASSEKFPLCLTQYKVHYLRDMLSPLRTVRAIQIAMLVSVGIFAVIGEVTGTHLTTDPKALYAISFISISLVGAVLVVRKTMVLQSEDELKTRPGDPIVLKRWQTGYIVTYLLCELLGLFGLLLRIMGSPFSQVWPYYAGSFVMLLLFWPRLPRPGDNRS